MILGIIKLINDNNYSRREGVLLVGPVEEGQKYSWIALTFDSHFLEKFCSTRIAFCKRPNQPTTV